MSDRFLQGAKDGMGAIERLVKGLPGIRGYVDKEMRRDADRRLRELIARELEAQKQALFNTQQQLLRNGGLRYMATIDSAIQKLQILIDRVKTAADGYAGLFDPVKIREEQLDALYRFDVALANRTAELETAVENLRAAIVQSEGVDGAIDSLTELLDDLNRLFGRRNDAVVNPELLLQQTYAPDISQMQTEFSDLPDSSGSGIGAADGGVSDGGGSVD